MYYEIRFVLIVLVKINRDFTAAVTLILATAQSLQLLINDSNAIQNLKIQNKSR